MTKDGLKTPNYYGSLTHGATVRVGNYKGEEVHVPFSGLLPMVHPNDIVLGGWDISGMNLADAMERAQVSGVLQPPAGHSAALVGDARLPAGAATRAGRGGTAAGWLRGLCP